MVLIGISLNISNIEHVFVCLFAICVSSLERYLFRSFAQFPIKLLIYVFVDTEFCKFLVYFGQ